MKDTVVIADTGLGKSVIFQAMPVLMRAWIDGPGQTRQLRYGIVIVICPLKGLARDQVTTLSNPALPFSHTPKTVAR